MYLTIGNFDEIIDDDIEKINLNNNRIINLTPLSQLTNLTYLNLNNNQIIDLTPLSPLTKTNITISALPIIYHQNPTHPLILFKKIYLFEST
jgi:internalin A